MPNYNYDIIRVEDTEANLPNTLIAGQLGFATDTNKLGHLMLDGTTMQWYTSTEDSWLIWTTAGWGGVTTDTPDGKFHIYSSSAGAVTANVNYNDLVVENGGGTGISILGADSENSVLCFGSPSDNAGSLIKWNYDDNELNISAINSGSIVKLSTSNTLAITIDSNQNTTFAGDIYHAADNDKHYWGAGKDCSITYDGSHMYFDSQEVGSGHFHFINGNVGIGIGTGNPAEALEVYGKIKCHWNIYHEGDNQKHYWGAGNNCSITYDGSDMIFDSQEVGSGDFVFNNGDIKANDIYHAADNDKHYWGAGKDCSITYDGTNMLFNSQEVGSGWFRFTGGGLRLDDNDYIGIASDIDLLQLVSGNLTIAGNTKRTANNNKNYWGAGNNCSITYDGSDMIFDSQEVGSGDFVFNNGSIGIGTNNPLQLLHIYSSSTSAYCMIESNGSGTPGIRLYNAGTQYLGIEARVNHTASALGNHSVINSPQGDLSLFGSGNVILGIAGTGNVGINTTSPSEYLDVNGNGRFRSIGSGTSAGALHYESDGTLTTDTSDKRLKDNIKPIKNALEKICKLQGVNHTWKKDKKKSKRIGMIAQEVEKVIPELVFKNPVDGYKGIHYEKVVAYLVEAVKELADKI